MTYQLLNDASTALASALASSSATSAAVTTGDGARWAAASTTNPIRAGFFDASTGALKEIIDVTGRSTDTLTIVRAVEDAATFAAGTWTTGTILAAIHTKATLAPGRLLAVTSLNDTTTSRSFTTTSTTAVDVDAVSLAVPFVAPPSGNVVVVLSGHAQGAASGSIVWWNLRDGSGDIAGTMVFACSREIVTRCTARIEVTGLTAGTVYTWKWGQRSASGQTASLKYGGPENSNSTSDGQLLMEVYAAS